MGTLPSSGQMAFSALRSMYVGGTGQISLSMLYRGGNFVPNVASAASVPSAGQKRFGFFRGTAKEYVLTLSTNQTNYNWATAFATAFPANSLLQSNYIARLIIPSGVTVGSSSTGTPALTVSGSGFNASAKLFIDIAGNVHGAAGAGGSAGAGGNGGTAIDASTVTQNLVVSVASTGRVYGGGGGGGSGGNGGAGGQGGNGNYTTSETRFRTVYVSGTLYTGDYVARQASSNLFYWDGPLINKTPLSVTSFTVNNVTYSRGNFRTHPYGSLTDQHEIIRAQSFNTFGGAGGAGGAGGSGGTGQGFNVAAAAGTGGSVGAGGADGGTNAGAGGSGGTGGTGGAGGAFGVAGASGGNGNTGNTGASGNAGGGSAGSGAAAGSSGGQPGNSVFRNGRTNITVITAAGADVKPVSS